jgi:carboxymethylenebutenolidase
MTIHSEVVQIPLGSSSFSGYLARPQGSEPLAAVVVFMEIFGINAHIREVTERIASEGYVAIVPDYFHRTAPGMQLGYDSAGIEEGRKQLRALEQPQLFADLEATFACLDARADVQRGHYGAIGFCIGGHVAYLAATTGRVRATASLYGGGLASATGLGGGAAPLSLAGQLSGRLLFLFGGRDHTIALEQVHAIEAALAEHGKDAEVVVYDDAGHGFFCELRASYQPSAAQDAWQRIRTLFAERLRGA